MAEFDKFPTWRYGPGGASVLCENEAEVKTAEKKGFGDHPAAFEGTEAAKEAKAAKPATNETKPAADASAAKVELDADGHPWDPALHAATKSKTGAGLWRLKVGVSRPKPKAPLDL